MRVFFGKGTLLEINSYESDAISHQKEDIFNENWSEFILRDWNQMLRSKVSYTRNKFTDFLERVEIAKRSKDAPPFPCFLVNGECIVRYLWYI